MSNKEYDKQKQDAINNMLVDPYARLNFINIIMEAVDHLTGTNADVAVLVAQNEQANRASEKMIATSAGDVSEQERAAHIMQLRGSVQLILEAAPLFEQLNELGKKYNLFKDERIVVQVKQIPLD